MEAWKKKRRQEYLEQKEFRYYIFCEGQQTEPQYFNGFKKYIESNPIYKDMVLVEIEPCGAETMRVIGQAEEYVRKNKITKGQIWCVYDKDSFPAERFNGVLERAEALNLQNEDVQYHAAWSNECIEFWFILHFSYYTSNNHRSEYPEIREKLWKEAFWSQSFFLMTVGGAPVEVIRKYIESQGESDEKKKRGRKPKPRV